MEEHGNGQTPIGKGIVTLDIQMVKPGTGIDRVWC